MDRPALIPLGVQTYSKGRAAYPANAPRFAVRADGPYVWCDDGRRYIDCVSALGAISLGHGHPDVNDAVRRQLDRGVSFSLPTALEEELAARIVDRMPAGDWMVRFHKNGSDVTTMAVRLARAYTGRTDVLMHDSGYHGFHDWSLLPPKLAGTLGAARAFTQHVSQDPGQIGRELRDLLPACLIAEPVVAAAPERYTPERLRVLRRMTEASGALLVLDEVVTGMRMGLPGACAAAGVAPDLLCLGKAIANGFPLSVLVGRREIMERIERDVFVSSTFGGEALSLAAAVATWDVAVREDLPGTLEEAGLTLIEVYNDQTAQRGIDSTLVGHASRPIMRWADPDQGRRFMEALIDRGLLCAGYFNLTLATVQEPVFGEMLAAVADAFDCM